MGMVVNYCFLNLSYVSTIEFLGSFFGNHISYITILKIIDFM
jgi:hypothetical protein